MGISDSANRLIEARNKKEKQLQLSSGLGKTSFGAIKGVVSADGDGKRSSGVDELARNEPPSQVVALTSAVSYVVTCSIWCLACI